VKVLGFAEEIIQEEEYFRKRYRKFNKRSKGFKYEKGNSNILFSAPHATAHMRDGRVKQEDAWTGGIVRCLHRITGVHIIYSTYLSVLDPNNTFDSEYKQKIASIVTRHSIDKLFDLHGMAYHDEIGRVRPHMCYGIGRRGETIISRIDLVNDLRTIMREHGIEVFECNILRAADERRVAQYASSTLKIKSMQIEIREDLRNPLVKCFPNIENFIEGLIEYVNLLKEV
jgi:hypothetical protein